MKYSKRHVCEFTRTSKILDTYYPPNSNLSKIRRKFRESLLISEENGRRCFTRKGNAGYIYEKEMHLTQYFHMIHPFSKFRQYWEIFAILELCLTFIVRVFFSSTCTRHTDNFAYQIFGLFADLFEISDVLLLFVVGYIDKETQEVVLERRRICRNYIRKFYFYINLLISFPLEFCVYLYTLTVGAPLLIFQYVIFLKIFKVFTFTLYLKHTAKIYNWSDLHKVIAWTIAFHVLLAHWFTCLFHVILYDVNNVFVTPENKVIKSHDCFYHHFKIYFVINSIMFKRNGFFDQHVIETIADKCFWFLTVVIIYFANVVLGGLLIQYLALMKTSDVYYEEIKQEVQKFLAQENVPKHIHEKVLKYLKFRYRHTYFFEKIIFETLSPALKREVANFFCYNLLIHPRSIFLGIPDELASDLCLLMKYEIFLPGDIIFRAGGKAPRLYLLYSGSVVVYSAKEKEIMHWYEGQQFGASSFVPKALHPVTAIALEMTECYSLLYKDFVKAAGEKSEYIEMLHKAATARRQYIMELYAED